MVNHGYKIEKFILEKLGARKSDHSEFDGENEKAIFEIKFISQSNNYARFIRKNFLLSYGYALAQRKKYIIILAYEFRNNAMNDVVKVYATDGEIFFADMKSTEKEIVYVPYCQLQATDITSEILQKS